MISVRAIKKINQIESFPAKIYLFKLNNKNKRKRCGICLKFTIKTPEQLDVSG